MNKSFTVKILISILKVVIVFIAVFGALIASEYFIQGKTQKNQLSKISLYHNSPDKGLVKVLGEAESDLEHESNQFVVQDITLGGETLMAMTSDDKSKGIAISHLQGKLYQSSEDEDINYYASWQSNKPTLSTIEYKNEEDNVFNEVAEENYGYIHTLTLNNIDFASVYQYVIQSKDRWGNESSSGQFVFYTGSSKASFLELLEESFEDIFGWIVNK